MLASFVFVGKQNPDPCSCSGSEDECHKPGYQGDCPSGFNCYIETNDDVDDDDSNNQTGIGICLPPFVGGTLESIEIWREQKKKLRTKKGIGFVLN